MSYDIQVIYHNSYLVSVLYHVHPCNINTKLTTGVQFCFCMYATKTLEKQKQNFALYRSTVLLLCVYYKNACKSKSKTSPSTGVQFCFCILQKRLQKQKQNFALYRSTVLLLCVNYKNACKIKSKTSPSIGVQFWFLYVYYKNACKSKSKTSPSTGVQFCFCLNILLPASKQQP
jgi:hypothetical protein